ncbi:TPA: hypothetical protein ACGD77_000776 [Serratia marcescens]|nr:hypothetical protein SMKC034_20160 [Serratia marcescens]
MKDYKNTSGTKILLLFSLAFYSLHFNPFLADRGIPGYQTFFYLLMLWLGMNILLWLLVWGTGRLYRCWRAPRG